MVRSLTSTARTPETARGSPSAEVGGKRCNSAKLSLRRESSRGLRGERETGHKPSGGGIGR